MKDRSVHCHGFGIDHRDDHVDDDVVPEQDHLPPHQPVDMHRQRRRKLFDQTLVGDEHLSALEDRGVDQVPDDQSERDVRKVFGQFELEQLGVQPAHRHRRGTGGDRDPEGSQHGSPITLLDVLPAEVQPQFAPAEACNEVTPRPAESSRLRGGIHDRHVLSLPVASLAPESFVASLAPVEPLAAAQAPQSNPFPHSGGVALGHQEIPAEPKPLLEHQLAHPRLRLQIAPVAVGEEPLRRVVGVLGVHPTAQDRLEFVSRHKGAGTPRSGRCRTAARIAPAAGAFPSRHRG